MWFTIERSNDYKDLAICAVYFPPEGLCNNLRGGYFKVLQRDILHFKLSFDIMILGDFNARIGDLLDYNIHMEDKSSENPSGELTVLETFPNFLNCQRSSNDKGNVNVYGRKLIELCKSGNIRILNDHLKAVPGLYNQKKV